MEETTGSHDGEQLEGHDEQRDQAATTERGFTLMLTQAIKPSALRTASPPAKKHASSEATKSPEQAPASRPPPSRNHPLPAQSPVQDPPLNMEKTASSISAVDQLNSSGQQGRST